MIPHKPENDLRACDGVTRSARLCRRKAIVEYHLTDGTVRGYCSQHDGNAGINRMLKPYPWNIVERVER